MTKKAIYKKTLELIEKHKLIYVEDIISMLPISKPTFYDKFKVGTNEFNTIKEAIDKNKVALKVNLRKRWYESDNPTLQMGIYKLLANDGELSRLNNKQEQRVSESSLDPIEITITNEVKD